MHNEHSQPGCTTCSKNTCSWLTSVMALALSGSEPDAKFCSTRIFCAYTQNFTMVIYIHIYITLNLQTQNTQRQRDIVIQNTAITTVQSIWFSCYKRRSYNISKLQEYISQLITIYKHTSISQQPEECYIYCVYQSIALVLVHRIRLLITHTLFKQGRGRIANIKTSYFTYIVTSHLLSLYHQIRSQF